MSRAAAVLFLAMLMLTSCATAPHRRSAEAPAPSDVIVLLPNRDGTTGVVEVLAGGTSRRLFKPWHALQVPSGGPPGEQGPISPGQIRDLSGGAMQAMPDLPIHFILYFDSGTAKLTKESWGRLAAAVRAIRQHGHPDISVVGHTDTAGDKAINDHLSLKRARAVAELLAVEGVDPSGMEVTSHGKENPLVPTRDQVAEPRNRRVEITVR